MGEGFTDETCEAGETAVESLKDKVYMLSLAPVSLWEFRHLPAQPPGCGGSCPPAFLVHVLCSKENCSSWTIKAELLWVSAFTCFRGGPGPLFCTALWLNILTGLSLSSMLFKQHLQLKSPLLWIKFRDKGRSKIASLCLSKNFPTCLILN